MTMNMPPFCFILGVCMYRKLTCRYDSTHKIRAFSVQFDQLFPAPKSCSMADSFSNRRRVQQQPTINNNNNNNKIAKMDRMMFPFSCHILN